MNGQRAAVSQAPDWLRHTNPDVDRVLLAAWLWHDGHWEIGTAIAAQIAKTDNPEIVEQPLEDIDGLLDGHALCSEDPEMFAWINDGLKKPAGTWVQWREVRLPLIEAEIVAIAARIAGVQS